MKSPLNILCLSGYQPGPRRPGCSLRGSEPWCRRQWSRGKTRVKQVSYCVALRLVVGAEDDSLLASLEAAAGGARALKIDGIDVLEIPDDSISPAVDPETPVCLDLSLAAECLKDTRGLVDLHGESCTITLSGVDLLFVLRELPDKQSPCVLLRKIQRLLPRWSCRPCRG